MRLRLLGRTSAKTPADGEVRGGKVVDLGVTPEQLSAEEGPKWRSFRVFGFLVDVWGPFKIVFVLWTMNSSAALCTDRKCVKVQHQGGTGGGTKKVSAEDKKWRLCKAASCGSGEVCLLVPRGEHKAGRRGVLCVYIVVCLSAFALQGA